MSPASRQEYACHVFPVSTSQLITLHVLASSDIFTISLSPHASPVPLIAIAATQAMEFALLAIQLMITDFSIPAMIGVNLYLDTSRIMQLLLGSVLHHVKLALQLLIARYASPDSTFITLLSPTVKPVPMTATLVM